jgi:hypothetical protein
VGLTGAGEVSATRLAEILVEHGWQGGHIRLLACNTALPNAQGVIYAKELSIALNARGLPTVVSAPEGLVGISQTQGPGVLAWIVGVFAETGDVTFAPPADMEMGIFGLTYFP